MQTDLSKSVPLQKGLLVIALLSALIGQSYVLIPHETIQLVFNGVTASSLLMLGFIAWPRQSAPIIKRLIKAHWITIIYVPSLLFLAFGVQDNDQGSLPIPLAYIVSIIAAFVIMPVVLLNDLGLYRFFLGSCSLLSAVCGLTALLSVAGVKSIGVVAFSIKEAAAYNFLGLYATGGILEHPLSLGTQAYLGIMVSYLWYLRTQQSKVRWVAVGSGMFSVAGMVISQGRGAWLAAGASLLVMALFQKRRIVNVLVLALLVPLMWISVGKAEDIIPPSSVLGRALRIQMGTSARDILWEEGIQIISQKPLTGWGIRAPGKFSAIIEAETLGDRGATVGTAGFHNSFIDHCVAYGVFVGGIYSMMFLVTLWRSTKFREPSRQWRGMASIVLGSIISIVFVSYNIGGLRLTSVMISILLGLAFVEGSIDAPKGTRRGTYGMPNRGPQATVRLSVT